MEVAINLEQWLKIKLDFYENNLGYQITTNDVRKWIDTYNDVINRGYVITQNINNENR